MIAPVIDTEESNLYALTWNEKILYDHDTALQHFEKML